MKTFIVYDISSSSTRTKFFKLLKNYGINIQKSVFDCNLNELMLSEIIHFLRNNLDEETDKCFIIPICNTCFKNTRLENTDKYETANFKVV